MAPKPINVKGSRFNPTFGAEQAISKNILPGQENPYADADAMASQLRAGLEARGIRLPSVAEYQAGLLQPQLGQANPLISPQAQPQAPQQAPQPQARQTALQGGNFLRAKEEGGKRQVKAQALAEPFQEFDLSHFDDAPESIVDEEMAGFHDGTSDSFEDDIDFGAGDFEDESFDEFDDFSLGFDDTDDEQNSWYDGGF